MLERSPATTSKQHVRLTGRLVVIGFGSLGQAVLPLIFRHLGVIPAQVTIIKTCPDASGIARELGVRVVPTPLTQSNYSAVLEALLTKGDFLLNLSVNVSSLDLLGLCLRLGVLYLDTCNEPWPGRYDNAALPPAQRSNYALREEMLMFRREVGLGPTAVMTQGANPGLISALLKQALLNMAAHNDLDAGVPVHREGWAGLARRLGIKAIHVAERDTQTSPRRKAHREFVNTWSAEGFIDEGLQPAELGWGSHERHWPADALPHASGCGAAILLNRPGFATRVRSWTPLEGPFHGFLITHTESISLADYLTVREGGTVVYRPTVHYAYHPCDDTVLSVHEIAGVNWRPQGRARLLRDEITQGIDELGVLLMGHDKGVYWFGSRLSIDRARALAPYNNATTLQVVAGVLGGMVWALRNPHRGVVEPEEIDHRTVLEIASPYLGDVCGVYGAWTPLNDRSLLFEEPRDAADPWQFINVRVQ